MLIDTHCHLDAAEFDTDRSEVIGHALEAGVQAIVIPAVERANFAVVRELAGQVAGGAYALGIKRKNKITKKKKKNRKKR